MMSPFKIYLNFGMYMLKNTHPNPYEGVDLELYFSKCTYVKRVIWLICNSDLFGLGVGHVGI